MRPKLTLYSRLYCHLCETMQRELQQLGIEWQFEFEVVDIDRDTELKQRYNEFVPVLNHGDNEICFYQLDKDALRRALAIKVPE
ncbi:MAG: glutaredoxin family protein [Gammaproteobacteria bacterium]|nr:glutaredoxin family protein [Gammaproteobacteria bacterium]